MSVADDCQDWCSGGSDASSSAALAWSRLGLSFQRFAINQVFPFTASGLLQCSVRKAVFLQDAPGSAAGAAPHSSGMRPT